MAKGVLSPISIQESTWPVQLEKAIATMLDTAEFRGVIDECHVRGTPARVARAYAEHFSGVSKDPSIPLKTRFTSIDYDQMVVVADVPFVSWCAHHFLPFIGTYTFGYLPRKQIVGLSKIPRMIEIFCARPQVQEKLVNDVVKLFQHEVNPLGCGIVMDAMHTCACVRGVRKNFRTRTTALTKTFRLAAVKTELLMAVKND